MTDIAIPRELVTLTQVIAESDDLRTWLLGLSGLPQTAQKQRIDALAADMTNGHEDPKLIAIVRLLSDRQILSAILKTLEE